MSSSHNPAVTTAATTAQHKQLSQTERLVIGLSVLCLCGALVLRILAARDYLWLDELHTAWTVSGGPGDVYGRAVDGNQTPLFFYLCFAVVTVFGCAPETLRAMSVAGGALLLVLLPVVVYRVTRCAMAVFVVSLFLMLDYESVFYASEARPYGMLQWLGGLQAVCFFRWITRVCNEHHQHTSAGAGWLTVSMMSAALIATHITGAWLLVAEAVFVLCFCAVRREAMRAELWKCLLLFLVLSSPVALTVAIAWQRRDNWSSISDIESVMIRFAWSFGGMVVVPLLALMIDRFAFPARKSSPRGEGTVTNAMLGFVGLWAAVPTLMVVGLDWFEIAPLALGRYVLVGSIAFPLFAVLAVTRLSSGGLRWLTLVLVTGILVWNATAWLSPPFSPFSDWRNENWSDTVTTIARGDPAYPVLLAANLVEDVAADGDRSPRFQDYLKFPVLGVVPGLKNPVVGLNSQGTLFGDRESAAVDAAGGGWLIVRDLPENVPWIMEQVHSNPGAQNWQFDLARFASPDPNYVLLFRISRR